MDRQAGLPQLQRNTTSSTTTTKRASSFPSPRSGHRHSPTSAKGEDADDTIEPLPLTDSGNTSGDDGCAAAAAAAAPTGDPEKGRPRGAPSPSVTPPRRSHERQHYRHNQLRKSVSNALARAASHLTTRSIPEPPPPPPDGGLVAWTQVACAWLVIFTTWGYVNAFGAFQAYYTDALAPLSPSTVSWIGSVQVWLTFSVGAFSGRLLDAGLFHPTMVGGVALQLLGVFLMSVSTEFWHLMLTQGLLTGVGGGLFFTPAMGLVATYFEKRRAVAVGLATTGNSVGGLLYPVVVRQLLPAVGFAWTTRAVGFVNLACLGTALTFMRPRLPPRKSGPLIDPSAFREPVYALLVTGLFFMLWGMYYSFYYIASFGSQILGMPYSTAAVTVIIVNAAGLPTRLATPFLAGRFGCFNMVLPAALLVAVTTLFWMAVTNEAGYYAFAAVYGTANGAFHCLMPTVIASASPRLDMVGTRLGMAFAVIGVAALTGPPLGGALQGAMGGSFTGANVWAAVSGFVCVALFSVARGFLTGWKVLAVC